MWKKIILLLLLILVAVALAWYFFKPVPPTKVSAVEPQVQSLSTHLDLNAVVINDQVVTITALLNGEIGKIQVSEGTNVQKGQALALLDNQQAQSMLDKARAELDYKQKKFNSANRAYARIKSLSNAGNASKQQLDDSLDAYRASESEVSVAKATVTLAELQLQNATIEAPFAGVITEQYAETGQWVEAGTPLFKLVAANGYLIEAQVDASDWASVSENQSVLLTTESAPDYQWYSSVSWIAPTVALNDRNAKAVAIRFPLGEKAPELLLSQELNAELELERIEDALTLPLSALIETEPGEYAVFVNKGDRAVFTPIEVGLINATHAEIVGGIGENTQVIVARQGRLTNDMPIEIQ